MMRHLVPCLLLGFAASTAPAQTPQPQVPLPRPIQTLRSNSHLVVVDVVVQDKQGNPVHNLKQSDFRLLEDNKPQEIGSFDEHAAVSASAPLRPMPKMPPGSFTNYSPSPANSAVNVLLLDALNTPMKDQAFVRDQMLKYLKTPRPGVRMAIFGLNQQLHMLQGLTTDPELLRAVVDGKKGLPKASAMFDNAVDGDQVGADTAMSQMEDMAANTPGAASIAANLAQFDAQMQSFQDMMRARYTLDALESLGRYLSSIPGRKNLIWFSGSFPIDILPDDTLTDPFAVMADMEEEYRETVNMLARAQVSVYPIDARGLMTLPMMQASNSGSRYAKSPSAMTQDINKFSSQTFNEHSTMFRMAEDTGGQAFVNTNGLKEAVEKAVNTGANYYTLTYTPSNNKWQGDFRKIDVKLEERGYKLAFRHGYYAEDPDAPAPRHGSARVAATAPTAPPFDAMHLAMEWGAPQPTEVIFATSIRQTTGKADPAPVAGTQLSPKVSGPYRQYRVLFDARSSQVTSVANPDGSHHIALEFVTFAFDDQGVLLSSAGKDVVANLSEAQYKTLSQSGMQYLQEISVPQKTTGFLRVGVRDLLTNKVGSVEIPIEAVSRLKPLSAEVTPAAP